MLRIPEFRMRIDAPADHGLAAQGGIYVFGPVDASVGLWVKRAEAGDDPAGDLVSKYELMAAFGPIGTRGATFLNRKGDEDFPFLGAIASPDGELFLLPPFNPRGYPEDRLRRECARLIELVGFVTPEMERWIGVLSGATLVAIDTHRREIATADGYSSEERYVFRADGVFEWRRDFHVSLGGGGLSASRTSRSERVGSWDVVDEGGAVGLRLEDEEEGRRVVSLGRRGNAILLGGEGFGVERRG
jgi:hypothetical protein